MNAIARQIAAELHHQYLLGYSPSKPIAAGANEWRSITVRVNRPNLTVRAVCRATGLTERYFYESFADRDEFVRAVYDDVCARAMSALTTANTPRDAVEKFVALMVDDPARGRVLLLAPEKEPVLTRSGAEWMPSFIELVQRKLTRISDPAQSAMVATGLIGALTALFIAYLNGRLAASREQFIDYCVEMLLSRVSSF